MSNLIDKMSIFLARFTYCWSSIICFSLTFCSSWLICTNCNNRSISAADRWASSWAFVKFFSASANFLFSSPAAAALPPAYKMPMSYMCQKHYKSDAQQEESMNFKGTNVKSDHIKSDTCQKWHMLKVTHAKSDICQKWYMSKVTHVKINICQEWWYMMIYRNWLRQCQ